MTIDGHVPGNLVNNNFLNQEEIKAKLLTKQDKKGSLESKITKLEASLIKLKENTEVRGGGSSFIKGAQKIALFFNSIFPQIDLFFTKFSLSFVNKDIIGLIAKQPHARKKRQYSEQDIFTRDEIRKVRSLKNELLEYSKDNPGATKDNLIEFITDKLKNAEDINKNPKKLNDFINFFKESIENSNENSLVDMVAFIENLHLFKLGGMK